MKYKGRIVLRRAFTLVELVVVLSISFFLLIATPVIALSFKESYATNLFFKEFENHFKVVQMAAITTGKPSSVMFNATENTVAFVAGGEQALNKTLELSEHLKLQDTLQMTLKEHSGAANKFKNITFFSPQGTFIYHFQMGGAKFYVEKQAP